MPAWDSEHWLAVDMPNIGDSQGDISDDELRQDILVQPELHLALYTQTAARIDLIGTAVAPLNGAGQQKSVLSLRTPRSKIRRRKGMSDDSGTITIEWSKQLEREFPSESIATHMRFDMYAHILSLLSRSSTPAQKLSWFMYVLDRDGSGSISSEDIFFFLRAIMRGLDDDAIQAIVVAAMGHMAKQRGSTAEELERIGLNADDITMLVPEIDLMHRLQINLGEGLANYLETMGAKSK
jgi:hypothetical protein